MIWFLLLTALAGPPKANRLVIETISGRLRVMHHFTELAVFPIGLGPRRCKWAGHYRTGRWERGNAYYRALEIQPVSVAPDTCTLKWIRGLGRGLGAIGESHLQTQWTWMEGALTNHQMDRLAQLLDPAGAKVIVRP